MNVVPKRTLEDLQNGINIAPDTKTAIRKVAAHYNETIKKLKLMEEEKGKEQEKGEKQELNFNPAEVETLVYREQNEFKKSLATNVSGKVGEKENSTGTSIEREDR